VEAQLRQRIQRMLTQFGGAKLDRDVLVPLVERWQEELRPQVEREVRLALLAPEIAKREKIEASDEEIDAQLARIAEASQRKLSEVKREYREHGLPTHCAPVSSRRRWLNSRSPQLTFLMGKRAEFKQKLTCVRTAWSRAFPADPLD
jgi:hypothetical protein